MPQRRGRRAGDLSLRPVLVVGLDELCVLLDLLGVLPGRDEEHVLEVANAGDPRPRCLTGRRGGYRRTIFLGLLPVLPRYAEPRRAAGYTTTSRSSTSQWGGR